MVGKIHIHPLTLDELSGVITLYPWYSGARMEFCRRMAEMGALSESQVAETALHLEQRRVAAALLQRGRTVDCSDKDTRRITDTLMPAAHPSARVYVVGGDYFSQDQYEEARSDGDGVFSQFAAHAGEDKGTPAAPPAEPLAENEGGGDFCTETLARIYLEQGYKDEAREIYSKLSLRYPEKSVYFAALIDEINKKDN